MPLILWILIFWIYTTYVSISLKDKEIEKSFEERKIETIIENGKLDWISEERINNDPYFIEAKEKIRKIDLDMNSNSNNTNTTFLSALSYIIFIFYILMFWVSIVSYIKRLKDLDKNPWMILLILVPFANIYLWIICGFFKWTVWLNKYGEDPLAIVKKEV